MSADVKDRPIPATETEFWYSAESLRFARRVVSAFEDQLKNHARELAFAASRDTISEEDMRDAAVGLLRNLNGIVDDPSDGDAR
jgi:histone H3/H4